MLLYFASCAANRVKADNRNMINVLKIMIMNVGLKAVRTPGKVAVSCETMSYSLEAFLFWLICLSCRITSSLSQRDI